MPEQGRSVSLSAGVCSAALAQQSIPARAALRAWSSRLIWRDSAALSCFSGIFTFLNSFSPPFGSKGSQVSTGMSSGFGSSPRCAARSLLAQGSGRGHATLRAHWNWGAERAGLPSDREQTSRRDSTPDKFLQRDIVAVLPGVNGPVAKLCELLFGRDDKGCRRPRPRPGGVRGIDAPCRVLKVGQRALVAARPRRAPGAAAPQAEPCGGAAAGEGPAGTRRPQHASGALPGAQGACAGGPAHEQGRDQGRHASPRSAVANRWVPAKIVKGLQRYAGRLELRGSQARLLPARCRRVEAGREGLAHLASWEIVLQVHARHFCSQGLECQVQVRLFCWVGRPLAMRCLRERER